MLVADDDPSNVAVLKAILEPEYEVLVAADGEGALRTALEELPDLILLDIMMPKLDGYEVCAHLKGDPRTSTVPVIFITAKDEEEEEAMGLRIGGIDYITKPISAPILLARVRNHLQLKRYRDLLEDLSRTDSLTGVANRRRFDEVLIREWEHAVRHRLPLSMILIDVDHFKQYNDSYGHAAGDECLRQLAATMASVVRRQTDLLARYGGEEFSCLLSETDLEEAMVVARRLAAQVRAQRIPHAHSATAPFLTVSMGVGTAVPTEGDDVSKLIEKADQLLYQAKEGGRNRIEAGELVPNRRASRSPPWDRRKSNGV